MVSYLWNPALQSSLHQTDFLKYSQISWRKSVNTRGREREKSGAWQIRHFRLRIIFHAVAREISGSCKHGYYLCGGRHLLLLSLVKVVINIWAHYPLTLLASKRITRSSGRNITWPCAWNIHNSSGTQKETPLLWRFMVTYAINDGMGWHQQGWTKAGAHRVDSVFIWRLSISWAFKDFYSSSSRRHLLQSNTQVPCLPPHLKMPCYITRSDLCLRFLSLNELFSATRQRRQHLWLILASHEVQYYDFLLTLVHTNHWDCLRRYHIIITLAPVTWFCDCLSTF